MLDIRFIKDNKEIVKAGAIKKHMDIDVYRLCSLDDKRIELSKKIEEVKAKQNEMSQKIPSLGQEEKEKVFAEMKLLKESSKIDEDILVETMKEWRSLMLAVPNIPDMSVPEGESDADNVEVRVWGEAKSFDFSPLSHMDIMEKRDWVDFERGSKAAGFRGYFLKGDAALLEMALWLWGMNRWQKKGFMPMIVPSLVRKEALMGTGYLPGGEDDLYKDGDDYLSGTGEVATMFYHSDEIIDFKTGPKKFVAFSPCFRKEIGTYNKDVKGLIRVHEFFKVEQVVLCEASHEESVRLHEEITRNSEEMLEELGIPYHTVVNCAGDLGQGQVKKYDIEAWVPSQSKYRETHSASYFHDYQTRRLNIRYKDNEGKLKFAHSLNNTALATPRLLAILIENYQNADGSVTVPEVLRNYMGGREII